MAPFAELKPQSLDKNKKILVIYYSLTGHTKDIAERIKAQTNADLYAIELKQPLPTGLMAYYQIWKQYKDKSFPEVTHPFVIYRIIRESYSGCHPCNIPADGGHEFINCEIRISFRDNQWIDISREIKPKGFFEIKRFIHIGEHQVIPLLGF